MKIPNSFLLRGHRWTIKRKKVVKNSDGEMCTAVTDVDRRIIEIKKDVNIKDLGWLFYHEYGHALLFEAGVTVNSGGISELVEEIICDAIAEAFTKDKTVTFKRSRK